MLDWYWGVCGAACTALLLSVSARIRRLNGILQGDTLEHDPLEAAFAAERLAALVRIRRVALLCLALCIVGALASTR